MPSESAQPPEPSTVFLPKEHGSWSLALEPLALGFLAAPSLPGAALGVGVLAAFFSRRPVKTWLTAPDPARRHAAILPVAILAALALAAGVVTVLTGGLRPLWPLLLVAPLGALFGWFELRGNSRAAAAELAGTTAFSLLPAASATVAGEPAAPALALAALMLARSVPTVLLVRAFLQQAKGQPMSAGPAWITTLAAAGGATVLSAARLAPPLAAWLAWALLVRTVVLLGRWRPALGARQLGLAEAVLGVAYVVALALAWRA